ncbi:MAG: 16S rRNA (guanine(527)-N(7))-methyltransferase RsmG [Bacteroidales bacterium]|nr:16S rRNA (guanine(527)-N(7))-methyltransferase RsmG [Bacteroidales bacterium]
MTITPQQEQLLQSLEGLYREWNAKINVISRKDIDNVYEHHVLHSLAIAKYLETVPGLEERFANGDILDLGTGGGFPGIPLAILYPQARFTLCDSVNKKTIVAEAVSKALDLKNVQVINARAESLGRNFDFVVSRAVASLTDFYPWVKGRFNNSILYLKGGDVNEEISQLMARHKIRPGKVHTWPVSSWLHDEYYDGKLVIHIEK